jgi:hypothetical protein
MTRSARRTTDGLAAYIELPSDHEQTAFLASVTPEKARADVTPMSEPELQRAQFLGERTRISNAEKHRRDVDLAMVMARLLRVSS